MAPKKTTKSEHGAPKKFALDKSPSANRDIAKKGTLSSKKGISKKTPTTQATKSEASKSYKELIVEALITLEDRRGSSRPAIKKYIKENYPSVGGASGFDSYFNNAVKKGVQANHFDLPKGPSGALKLAKKTPETIEKTMVEKKGKKSDARIKPLKPASEKSAPSQLKAEEDSKRYRGRTSSHEAGGKNGKSRQKKKVKGE